VHGGTPVTILTRCVNWNYLKLRYTAAIKNNDNTEGKEAVMLFLLLYALVGDIRAHAPEVHYCDIIEINKVYDEDTGNLRFKQVIFWEWRQALNYKKGRQEWNHYVTDWRSLSKTRYQRYYDYGRKQHVFNFYDQKDRMYRSVRATSFRATTTLYDVELEDRKKLPPNFRRHLLQK